MATRIFVDGQEGTTGLKIHERLAARSDIEIIAIDPDKRKDINTRKEIINSSDIVFLCLPDTAAREAVSLVENQKVRIIDASTAHRIDPQWTYGFPEFTEQSREQIKKSKRISVPGCYATGFVSIVRPLIDAKILSPESLITAHAVSGYSGGGKKLISEYENPVQNELKRAPRFYALGLQHKHIPEMRNQSGLTHNPLFNPIVSSYYNGMIVTVPLHLQSLSRKVSLNDIHSVFTNHYKNEKCIRIMPFDCADNTPNGFLDPTLCNGTNRLDLFIFGNNEHAALIARLDNLGKGASGAAVQCMNILMGCDELSGLIL